MNDIIKIETDEQGIKTVNARDLHGFLESKQDFSNWIKNRIKKYRFVENNDFVLLNKIVEQVTGSKTLIEYHISIDMAKELSMVERNEKGKQARQYFILCERIAKEGLTQVQLPDFTNPAIAARAWADEIDKKLIAEKTIKKQAPIIEAHNRIAIADGSLNMTEAAKHLQIRPIDLRKNILQRFRWIYRLAGSRNWLGYQNKIQQGLLEHKVTTVEINGQTQIHTQFRITPKGLIKLAELINDLLK